MPLPTMPLLDTIRQGQAALASPSGPQAAQLGLQPTAGERTEQVQQLAGVAATGKETTPGSGGMARLSAIGEKLASLNTTMQAASVQAAGTLQATAQGQQAAAQQDAFGQQANLLTQKRSELRTEFTDKLSGMMQQSAEQIQQLTIADNRSKAEQMGAMLRLSNDEYVTKLNDEATRSRLDSSAQFRMTLASTVFDQEVDLLGSNLQFRNILQQDHRDAIKSIENMDLQFAMAMAASQNRSAAGTQMWSGAGTAAGTAAGAYATRDKTQVEPATAAPAESQGTTTEGVDTGTGASTEGLS